jgi:hypothetical protein
MRYFLKNFLIFLIPVVIYMLLVIFIDPYNYFEISKGIVNNKIKKAISYEISNPLYQFVEYEKRPTPYILLGTSQTGLLTSGVIKEYTGHDFTNMSYGGGTLPELITTFWELCNYTHLKEVYIGISFLDFNGSQYRNRIPEALKIKANSISYIFSKSTLESTFLIMKSLILNSKIEIGKPDMSEAEFWKYQLDVTANRFYSTHSYPFNYYESLKKISAYCKMNSIKLIFFIPASHIDVQKKVREFNFEEAENKFKEDIKKLGDVYDFNYPNELTNNRKNFSDPFHILPPVARTVVEEMFTDKKNIVIFSKSSNSIETKKP